MSKPTLHLLGIFHTIHSPEYSHCAFTGKALRFAKMVQPYGYKVVEYANEGSESVAVDKVALMTRSEFDGLTKEKRDKATFHGDLAQIQSPWHKLFEERLIPALRDRIKPRDIICHPFGHAHERIVREFPATVHLETGIGYNTLLPGALTPVWELLAHRIQ